MMKTLILSCFLAGCAGVKTLHVNPENASKSAAAAVRVQHFKAARSSLVATLRIGGRGKGPVRLGASSQHVRSEAHHRLPRRLVKDLLPEGSPEFPMEPGKAPIEVRTFNLFPFKLRRRAVKRRT